MTHVSYCISKIWVFLFVILVLFSISSHSYGTIIFKGDKTGSTVNNWELYWNSQHSGCFAQREQDGKTEFVLGVTGKNKIPVLVMFNPRWTFLKRDKIYLVTLTFDGRRGTPKSFKSIDNVGKNILLRKLTADEVTQIAKSSQLETSFNNQNIGNLSLKGTGAALGAIDTCHTNLFENLAKAQRLQELARSYYKKFRYEKAEPLYRQSLAIREKMLGREHRMVAQCLNNLANNLKADGKYAETEEIYGRVISFWLKVRGPEHRTVAQNLDKLAHILRRRGDLKGAEKLHRRALAIFEKIWGPNKYGTNLVLANFLRFKGDYAEAERLIRSSLIDSERSGLNHYRVLRPLNSLAYLLKKKGDLSGAESAFRRSLVITERKYGRYSLSVSSVVKNLAQIQQKKAEYVDAEKLYLRSFAIRKMIFRPGHPSIAAGLNNLASLHNDTGNAKSALDYARRASQIGRPSRSVYLRSLFSVGNQQQEIVNESLLAFQQTTSSSAGNAIANMASRFSTGSSELSKLVRQEQDTITMLGRLNNSVLVGLSRRPNKTGASRRAAILKRITKLNEELALVQSRLTEEFPDYSEFTKPRPISLQDTQSLLSESEALIILDVSKNKNGDDYVWLVTRARARWHKLDVGHGAIADEITKIRAGLDLADSQRRPIVPSNAFALYQKLLGPIEKSIEKKSHLIFVLNGAVSSLPPQVLVTKKPKDDDLRSAFWLARSHAITILPTIASLKILRTQLATGKAPRAFIGYGDPIFDAANDEAKGVRVAARNYSTFFEGKKTNLEFLRKALPRLPGTARELLAVGKSLGASENEIIVRKNASEKAVKQTKLDDYNIVYFATHGLVAGEVKLIKGESAEPALALTIPDKASELDDGLLTASEVAQLKLNADWVVLSACNTAAEGKPGADALSGLARSFFYAGARSLLVSHWVVDDAATAELMKRNFAFAAANRNKSGAEALRQAMLSLMDDADHPEWADPSFWAPFVLVGEPGSMIK